MGGPAGTADPPHGFISLFDIVFTFILVVIFYLNALMLIPAFVYEKRYWAFILSHLALVSLLWVLNTWYFNFFENLPGPKPPVFIPVFPYMFILACSTTYKILRDKFIHDQNLKEREHESLKTELQLLRSQVSPHFMFNVLNNIVSMARFKSEELEPTVIKLSSLMRYMLYEADEETVELTKEIEYLQSYIDLQSQRCEDQVEVNVSINITDKAKKIEPMLLIPFIENAFKHGTNSMTKGEINIVLTMLQDQLQLNVLNKYTVASKYEKDDASGIGLANVKRRLNLLYDNDHQLMITQRNGWFNVLLNIKLAS